jgi:cytochrome c biogenesis protein CcmG, thiol:disulfide interchange protein DsbE
MNRAATPVRARRRLAPLPLLVSLAGACLVGLLIYRVTLQSADRTLDEQVAEQRHPAAPDGHRALPLLSGHGRASIASFAGEVRVLNFWASWCEPCRAEAPLLQRAQMQLLPLHATVLGVSYLDVTPDAQAFVHRYRLTFPELRDTDGVFARSYGTNQLPESFVIDRAGHVVAISRGEIDMRFLDRAIALARSS